MDEMKKIPIIYKNKEECCGCGACKNICPMQAISMREDECGFIYPILDSNKCISCGKCKKVCSFQNRDETNKPLECYAAVNKNEKQSKQSASAGIFAALAQTFLEEDGIVYGAVFTENWGVHHVGTEKVEELEKIQGSKYAHSDTESTFSEVKQYLIDGRKVLYSGTPCQVAGLYGYLGRDHENLYTVDIVCHGVPSNQMLRSYLSLLSKKYRGKIEQFTFRDKSIGWGINGSMIIKGKKIKIWQSASSYIYYFTKGWIYRENCYTCKYASCHRPADITIGDFWGIEKKHPELIRDKGWNVSEGISLLISNTPKGSMYIQRQKKIDKNRVTFDDLVEYNAQLNEPSQPGNRAAIIKEYVEGGWNLIDIQFNRKVGCRKYASFIKSLIPPKLRTVLKRMT